MWQDSGLVFTASVGTMLSAGGVPVEEIAWVAGHKQTSTTELVYRRELRPVMASVQA